MNTTPIPKKKILIVLIVILLLVAIGLTLRYLATHGIVRITKQAEAEYALIATGAEYADAVRSKDSFMIVDSGDYIIELKNDDGLVQKNVSVPSWLGSANIELAMQVQRKVERVAGDVLDHITLGPGSDIVSFSTTSGAGESYLTHLKSDPSGNASNPVDLPVGVVMGAASNGRLIGFDSAADEELNPVIYNKGLSGRPTVYPDTSSAETAEVAFASGIVPTSTVDDDHFAITYQSEGNFMSIYNGVTGIQTLRQLTGAAKDGQGKITASVSSQAAAVGFGDDAPEVEDGDHSSLSTDSRPVDVPATGTKDYIVKIYDTSKGTVRREVNLGKSIRVTSISVSPDGSRLAVLSDERLTIYNTDNKARLFSYEGTTIENLMWLNNGQLLFADALNGLMRFDEKESTIRSLVSAKTLTVTSFYVTGDKVYFAAVTSNIQPSVQPRIDAYVMSLNAEATDKNILITALPYENDDIIITTLNNTIYASRNTFVRPPNSSFGLGFYEATVDNETKQLVTDYLQKQVPNYQSYKLVYGNNL